MARHGNPRAGRRSAGPPRRQAPPVGRGLSRQRGRHGSPADGGAGDRAQGGAAGPRHQARRALARACRRADWRCVAREPDHVHPLAKLVFDRTGGNPFFAIHFITELVEEGLLAFDTGTAGWAWDLPRIHAKGFADNVADLMASKLGRLPRATQEALKQMACLGNVTRRRRSRWSGKGPRPSCIRRSGPPSAPMLVLLQGGDYRFLHDRIHEAAYALIPEAERASTHLRIGRLLAQRTAPEQLDAGIFEIVNQLVRGAALIRSEEERRKVAALDLIAGKRAKAGTAYVSALRYLSAGRALLPADALGQILPADLRSRAEPGRMRVPDRRLCLGGGAVCLAFDPRAGLRRSRCGDAAVPRPLRDDGGDGPGDSTSAWNTSGGSIRNGPGI